MGFFAWQRFAWQNISWWFSVLDVPVTRWGGFSSSVCTACTDERDWSPVQFGSQWHRRLFTESYCMYYSTIASHNYYTMIKCRLRNLPISHLRDSAKTWLKHGWGIYFRNICWWCNRTNLKPEQNDLLSHNKKNFTKNMEGEEKHCRNETTLGDCFGQHRIRIQSARDGQVAFPVCRWLQSWHEFSWKPKKGSSHT